MKAITKILTISLLITVSVHAQAATYWVGSSTACTGSNVQPSLLQALFITALNGEASNEIRLTNTVGHTGNTNGNHTLTDRNSAGAGALTIVGGYADCFTSPSGRTVIGDSGISSFTVNTSIQDTSIITLRNLQLSGNASRGLVVRGGGTVTLDNVSIENNGFSGVDVGDGGYVEILANSVVKNNDNFSNPPVVHTLIMVAVSLQMGGQTGLFLTTTSHRVALCT